MFLASGGDSALMQDALRAYARERGMPTWERANVGAVIGFIAMAIILSVGVIILYQVESGTPAISNSSGWYATQTTLTSTASSGYGLLGISLIVMAAVAILGTLFFLVRGAD